MRDLITLLEEKSKPGDIEPVKLSYSDSALAPVLSGSNVKQHHKLWDSYCEKFNNKEGDIQYNYAGAILHNLYFTQFRSPRPKNPPNGPIGNLIKNKFKSWENFQDKFEDAALKFHGSGWIYLARDGNIKTIINHAIRQDVAIICDLWEHSYLSDYGGNKKKYISNLWRIMDWNVINTRYMAPYK